MGDIIMIMYDLPTLTKSDKANYRQFIKSISNLGYTSMQESIYIKYIRNSRSTKNEIKKVERVSPTSGDIMILPIKYKEFRAMKSVNNSGFNLNYLAESIMCFE